MKSRTVDDLAWEVEDVAVTLRREEWASITALIEIHQSGNGVIPAGVDLLGIQKRIITQFVGSTDVDGRDQ